MSLCGRNRFRAAAERTHRFEHSVVEEPFEVGRGGAGGGALEAQRRPGPHHLQAALEKRVRLHKRTGIWKEGESEL